MKARPSSALCFSAALGAAALAFGEPASAAQCGLVELASLPMQTESDGQISVPAMINGRPAQLRVDTGGWVSVLSIFYAQAGGLRSNIAGTIETFINNVPMYKYTRVKDFNLGAARGVDLDFYLIGPAQVGREDDGMLAPDIMRNFDMDFDFASGKLNVFSPNTCPAAPVYWTRQGFAQLPLDVDKDLKIIAQGKLDGQTVEVEFDSGSTRSVMSYEVARDLFGWAPQDPRVKQFPSQRFNGGDPVPIYRYAFGSLDLDGVQVAHPDIDMIPKASFGEGDRKIILLGINVLRQLHFYIGYQAKTLYLTPAEQH